jgi:hypothetical protein
MNGVCSYVYYFPQNMRDAFVNLYPLAAIPLLVWLLKTSTQFYFQWKLSRNEECLSELRQQRRDILSEVKNKETYKVAMEILEKYDPDEKLKRMERERAAKEDEERRTIARERAVAARSLSPARSEQLRRRPLPQTVLANTPQFISPNYIHQQGEYTVAKRHTPVGECAGSHVPLPTQTPVTLSAVQAVNQPLFVRPITPRVVNAPILPSERTPIDKIVDYLLGSCVCARTNAH